MNQKKKIERETMRCPSPRFAVQRASSIKRAACFIWIHHQVNQVGQIIKSDLIDLADLTT